MSEEQNSRETSPESFPDLMPSPESPSIESSLESAVTPSSAPDLNDASEEATVETLPFEQMIPLLQQEIDNLQQQLEDHIEQVDTYKKRYIGLAAEFDNFRKRTSKEKDELETKIKGKTLTEVLAVVDNFERARTQIKPANEGEMGIHKSYQGVYKTLVDSLKRLGVSPMRPEGQPFDPAYHEAMMREYTDEYPEGTVIEQLVRGYVLGDRVLRHALVKVAAPKETDPNAVEEADASRPEESALES
jgi:molecular chaperone GrpE